MMAPAIQPQATLSAASPTAPAAGLIPNFWQSGAARGAGGGAPVPTGIPAAPPPRLPAAKVSAIPNDINKNWLDSYWTAQTQGASPLCASFSTVACIELIQLGKANPYKVQPLSAEFLYWAARQWKPTGNGATPDGWESNHAIKLSQVSWALGTYGVCQQQYCAIATGQAPDGTAIGQAAANLLPGTRTVDPVPCSVNVPDTAQQFYSELAAGRPIAASFPLLKTADGSNNWQDGTATGIIPFDNAACPVPGVLLPYFGGHAVCILEFEPDENEALGGHFIFRNSHGIEFPTGQHLAHWPSGYGKISATAVSKFCWEALYFPANV